MQNISKENIKLAGELFCKCIELTTDRKVFSASLEFTSYIQSYTLIIYINDSDHHAVNEGVGYFLKDKNKHFKAWLADMMEILIEEKRKSDFLNSPEHISATKEKLKQEEITRLKKTLAELEA